MLCTAFVYPLDLKIYEENGKIFCGKGYKEMHDSLTVLHLKGKPLEIGYQYGKLLENDVIAAKEFWLSRLPRFELNTVNSPGVSDVYLKSQILPNLESQISSEYLSELHGTALALDKKVSWRELIWMHMAFDLYQFYDCITVAAREHVTRQGDMVIGRNINSFGTAFFGHRKTVCFYEPDNGLSFVTINPAGISGVVEGMNVNGLAICFTPLNSSMSDSVRAEVFNLDGMPMVFLLRKALQYGTNFEAAVKILSEAPRTRSGTVLVADAASNKMAFVEFSPNQFVVRGLADNTLYATNHFMSGYFADQYYKNLGESYQRRFFDKDKVVQGALQEYQGRLDAATMVALLRGKGGVDFSEVAYGGEGVAALSSITTLQSIVYLPGILAFWVAKPGFIPATANEYAVFSLNNEFKLENPRAAQIENIPASEIDHDETFQGIQYIVQGDILREEKNYPRALAMYGKGVAVVRKNMTAGNAIFVLEKYAELQLAVKDYQGCLASYTAIVSAVRAQPGSMANREIEVRTMTKEGMLYDLLGLRENALACYRQAVAVGDIYATSWREQAQKYLHQPYSERK
jgi:predicted choloylglycine hydrolase